MLKTCWLATGHDCVNRLLQAIVMPSATRVEKSPVPACTALLNAYTPSVWLHSFVHRGYGTNPRGRSAHILLWLLLISLTPTFYVGGRGLKRNFNRLNLKNA